MIATVQRARRRLGRSFHLDLEWGLRIQGAGGRCWEDYRSGGFFMELGCHLADLARHLMGDVRHVAAGALRLDRRRVTEDFTHALLSFHGGAIGSLVVSANHRTLRQGLLRGRLLGEKGRIDFTVYPYARAFNTATLTLDHGKSLFVPDTTVRPLAFPRPRSLFRVYPGFYDVYQRQMAAFLDAVRRGTPPPVTLDDGRAAVGIILAAYASQGAATDRPNLARKAPAYRADAACHPSLA